MWLILTISARPKFSGATSSCFSFGVTSIFLFANSKQSCKLPTVSVEQLESQILALPLAQRRAFTRWLDEHRDEIEQPSVLAQAQESEVRQRFAEMEANPAMRIPFTEDDAKRMFREFADARAHKTSSRQG
jgi:hypothetical protein